ncbi:FAD-linked oxidase C-terminal domain-containing protein [Salinisphaera sp. Q1T1-3]|uniref:FAD-linked oxidase C-terminal domain-containing protein n=1 Tax=Salinisphaera sp. Q1T1-3 TaxID=2321229 RepID=UPI000E73FEC7|nr:FAD-linked oxidase C-terminal domain-containing protein [Salinisphaera sp. Q1T1-3]RJS92674.1 FAD-binding protein [Salinisphaera sp. Q1T1-3]
MSDVISGERAAALDADGAASKATLVAALTAALPHDIVLTDEESLRPFECDGLSAYRALPMIAVLPATVAQVQTVMRICHAHDTPVVARGAGTGLSGGALPLEKGVLLSLAKFNRIVDIDTDNLRATVQPGVRNLAISEAVDHLGLYYAPDPSSQIACSIGGNVAENSGGVHCLKYGLTTHNIVRLEIVTVEGERLTIGSDALDTPGYDLLALMTGSEGLLGVIVEIVVKLLPKPELARVALIAFDDLRAAGNAVADIIKAGIIPAGLEMLDSPAIVATEAFVHAGYPTDATAILLCEVDGTTAEVDEDMARVQAVAEASGATEIRVSRDDAERALFWAGRKAAFPAMGRISPDYYCMDGTIPRAALSDVLIGIAELSEHYGQRVANVFHAGDGNLHPLILYDANQPGELERTEAFGGAICELCLKHGGTITGEHGVGVEKIDQMCVQFPTAELQQFHAVKAAFDEKTLLNPGKAVPTLHRCAEFGAMHVHNGALPFPELERL